MIKLYKLIESYNNNYIYYYEITNKKNIYKKYMSSRIIDFYLKYNNNGNFINKEFVKIIELNQYGKIKIDNIYVTPNEYFDIYI